MEKKTRGPSTARCAGLALTRVSVATAFQDLPGNFLDRAQHNPHVLRDGQQQHSESPLKEQDLSRAHRPRFHLFFDSFRSLGSPAMSSLELINPRAESVRRQQALQVNTVSTRPLYPERKEYPADVHRPELSVSPMSSRATLVCFSSQR